MLQGNASFSGDVNVVNSPTVHLAPGGTVGIAGTPNVNVTGLPAVQLAGGTIVGARNADALQFVQVGQAGIARSPGSAIASATLFTVPQGKVFVMEEFSGSALLGGTKLLSAFVAGLSSPGPGATHIYAVPTFTGVRADGLDVWNWGRLARVYALPNADVHGVGECDSSGGTAVLEFNISGYLVDVP
jgi:hypothetical protein